MALIAKLEHLSYAFLMATKNKVKMAAGRLGGLIGGKRRAKKLTAKRRSEIARLAGAVGGVVRMSKLSRKGRSELGQRAAAARWKKNSRRSK
jgi:hypothetical protein